MPGSRSRTSSLEIAACERGALDDVLGQACLFHVLADWHLDRLDIGDRKHGEHAVGDHHEELALHELLQAQLPCRLVRRLVGKGLRQLAAVDEMHGKPVGGIHWFSLSRRDSASPDSSYATTTA